MTIQKVLRKRKTLLALSSQKKNKPRRQKAGQELAY